MDIVTSETNIMAALNTGAEYTEEQKIERVMYGLTPRLSTEDLIRASMEEWTLPPEKLPRHRIAVFCKIEEQSTKEIFYEIAFYDKECSRFISVLPGGTPVFLPDNYKVIGWKDVVRGQL